MKALLLSMLVVGAAVAKGPPNLPLPAFTVEPPVPRMQPVPLPPSRDMLDRRTAVVPKLHMIMRGCCILPDVPLREPLNPLQTISAAYRTCTSVTLTVYVESGESASFVLPDGAGERRLFGLVTESLLYDRADDGLIWNVYYEELSLGATTRALDFSADLAVTFAGSESTRVQFDLDHLRALVTKGGQWDFYSIDSISAQALRRLITECQPQPLDQF